MNEKDQQIVQACREVVKAYNAYLDSKQEYDAWVEKDDGHGAGATRFEYEFREGTLSDEYLGSRNDYQKALENLKSILY